MKSVIFNKKAAAAAAGAILAAVILSVLLNNNFFIREDTGITYTIEDIRENYSPVFENNTRILGNIMEYGDEYCVGYVSVKKDAEVHRRVLAELKVLSDEICEGVDTDLEKVQKIEYWVADNLYYNNDAAETSVTAEVISLENVLETKTATCAGYSNLFSALCNMQDIYCVNLRGGTYIKQETPGSLLSVQMNHEWNAVRIDGEWLFIDTTWLSNNEYRNGEYIRSETMNTEYADMDFEHMSYEHRIDLADYRDFKSSVNVFTNGED